jgi:hypothetical protein
MTAVCSGGCGHSERSDSHRGGSLGTCPSCGAPMRGWTAGQAKGRYLCPISGRAVTLGLRYGEQLAEPMRAEFVPGWDTNYSERTRDPDRPGFLLPPGKYQRTEPTKGEQEDLDRAAGRVFGPGCVVSCCYFQREPGDVWEGKAGVYLVPVSGADPGSWFVNERLKYRKCAACNSRVPVTERTLMDHEWRPERASYYPRGRGARLTPTDPGPHPAGTVACKPCREGDRSTFQ